MTIDEAIKHCEEVAQENEKQFNGCPMKYDGAYANNGRTAGKCAEEHRQLAEWLKELKQLREVCTSKAFDMAVEALGQTDVLDKIKTEIEEQVLESLSDGGDDWFAAEKVNECLEIIDKYKAKSEEV